MNAAAQNIASAEGRRVTPPTATSAASTTAAAASGVANVRHSRAGVNRPHESAGPIPASATSTSASGVT